MANAIYNSYWGDNTTTIKVALVTSTYVPNVDTHANFSNVTNEITETGKIG